MTFDTRTTVSLILTLTLIFGGFSFASAHGGDYEKEPKLLPGDTLYFLKTWQRGIGRFFSFGALRDTSFEVKVMDQLAAEIHALGEKNDEESMALALQNYAESVRRLRSKVSSLDETSENKKMDNLLNALVHQIVDHGEIFRTFEGFSAAEEELASAKRELEIAVAAAVTKADTPDKFKDRVEKLVVELNGSSSLAELRVFYALNSIEDKMFEDFQGKIRELETDLTSRFEGRFRAEPGQLVPDLSSLPIRSARDLSIFDEIRERVTDSNLKSELSIIRQNAFKNGNSGIVEEEELLNIIHETKDAVEKLKIRISSDEYISSESVAELLERAEFHLAQASDLLIEGRVGTAFGQATAAQAAVRNGLSQIRLKDDIENDNLSLRVRFDNLVSIAKSRNLTREAAADLYDFFDRAEQAILLADTASDLRDAKIMLAELEVLIANGQR
jgi:hypothetical protein